MQHKITVVLIALISLTTFAQKAVKHQKQQTSFFYTQLNLHGGYVNENNNGRIDVTNYSPDSQISFRLFSKNKNLIQKGYVKKISLESYNIQVSIPYHKTVDAFGNNQGNVSLKLINASLKFKTKWDRTSFWLGYKSLPYGHNPKIDPTSSFMTNITKMDIGFAQDLGVFIRTPLSQKLDLELSLTSGGFLNKPIAVATNVFNESPIANSDFKFSDYKYDNTWLVVSRIGTPTFKKNEFGIILTSGKVKNPISGPELAQINRIGGDWIYKYKEKFKWSNQVVFGDNKIINQPYSTSIHLQTALDYYPLNNFIFSTSFAYTNFMNKDLNHKNNVSATSITYVFSPHTKLRLNNFYASKSTIQDNNWGILLQFVTGLGKRP